MTEKSLEVRRERPANFQMRDDYLFHHEWVTHIPPARNRIYDNSVFSSEIIFYHGIFKINEEATPERLHSRRWQTKLKRLYQRIVYRRLRLRGEYIMIIDDWSEGYFHWMTDALPRLIFFKEKQSPSIKLLVPQRFKKYDYVTSSLSALGAEIVYMDERRIFLVDKLYYPSLTAPTGNYNPLYLRKIRNSILVHFENFHEVPHNVTKIYISRKKSLKRKIVNEPEVEDVVKEFGYTSYCFEDFSWRQQLAIMRNARSLISNHGAGLTNMMFMMPSSSVIEFRRKGDSNNNCYFSMASVFEYQYFYQECASLGDDTFGADLMVDLIELRNNLGYLNTRSKKADPNKNGELK